MYPSWRFTLRVSRSREAEGLGYVRDPLGGVRSRWSRAYLGLLVSAACQECRAWTPMILIIDNQCIAVDLDINFGTSGNVASTPS